MERERERERERDLRNYIIALTIILLCVIFEGVVYNITPFMKYHPGGKAQLMRGAGNDCTELFDKVIDLLYTEHAVNLLYSVIADLESICLHCCPVPFIACSSSTKGWQFIGVNACANAYVVYSLCILCSSSCCSVLLMTMFLHCSPPLPSLHVCVHTDPHLGQQ